jgi:hypothetical protein
LQEEGLRVTVLVRGVREAEKLFEERDRVIRRGRVEDDPQRHGVRSVAEMPLAPLTHPRPGDDRAGEHVRGVLVDAVRELRRAT